MLPFPFQMGGLGYAVAQAVAAMVVEGDPYWENVSLLLHANGDNGSTTFTDSSKYGIATTVLGFSLNTTTKKFGTASGNNSAASGYVKTAANAAYTMGTGDYTVEGWFYFTSLAADAILFDFRLISTGLGGEAFAVSSAGVLYRYDTAVRTFGSPTLVINTWYHIAIVRRAGNIYAYVNGTQAGASQASTLNYTADVFMIGGATYSTQGAVPLKGYFDEIRLTKGIGRYTTNFFTPSREFKEGNADQYYDKVVLLLAGNGTNGSTVLSDTSILSNTVTANAGAAISTAQSKFGGSSLYFDGTNDYISITDATNFSLGDTWTVEYWMYSGTADSAGNICCGIYENPASVWNGLQFAIRNLSGITRFYFSATNNTNEKYADVSGITANAWHHIAMTRSGSTGYVFVDGVLKATVVSLGAAVAATQPVSIGRWDYNIGYTYSNVYMDDVRITKGVARYTANFPVNTLAFPTIWADPYYQNTSLLMHMEGLNNGIIFPEETANRAITVYGNAKTSTALSKTGLSSMISYGAGDYLSTPVDSAFNFGTGDFTLEAYVYLTASPNGGAIFSELYAAWGGVMFTLAFCNGTVGTVSGDRPFFGAYVGGDWYGVVATTAMSLNTWHHVAGSRNGNTWNLYVDGVLVATGTLALTLGQENEILIGRRWDAAGTNNYITGYLDEARITKGIGRYPAAFIPPRLAFPNF